MTRHRLDNTDLNILKQLQAEGRITNVELAKRTGISAPPCLRRLRALEEEGFVKSYHANLNAEKLDFPVTVFAMVNLSSNARNSQNEFAAAVQNWPRVRECHGLTGTSDFLLKIVAKSWEDYQAFLTRELTQNPLISSVNSYISIDNVKSEPGIPLELLDQNSGEDMPIAA